MNQQKDLKSATNSGVGVDAIVSRWGAWPALSIQQPWAWLILNAGKDIENRSWPTNYRGKFYIHTGQKFDDDGYEHIIQFRDIYLSPRMSFPEPQQFPKGGIIGIVDLIDCVKKAESKWADHWADTWNFVLEDAQEIDFFPLRGKLGFFNLNG